LEVWLMASVQKFAETAVVNQLRHVLRETTTPGNEDIDSARSSGNYTLSPDRGISPYSFYKARKSQLYCFARADVKPLAGWICTAPQDLPAEQHRAFFRETYRFLAERYGAENTVLATVHQDESGQPHLHYLFIPVVADKKHGGDKICANNVLNRAELRDFHPAWTKHLRDAGIDANVINGATAAAGGNRTVKRLKRERAYERQYSRGVTF
jgi:hypothetical protein